MKVLDVKAHQDPTNFAVVAEWIVLYEPHEMVGDNPVEAFRVACFGNKLPTRLKRIHASFGVHTVQAENPARSLWELYEERKYFHSGWEWID